MTPFFFGEQERRLYGVWHPPQRQSTESGAILICYPFGQEYVRCHRMLRILAERLSSVGYATLRFDYVGTGDSEGEDKDSRLSGWVKDVSMAHAELSRRAAGSMIIWLGVRLGATAALLASGRVAMPPAGLVLWEPIGSGALYLAELAAQHRQALSVAFAIPPDGLPNGERDEILGFGLGAGMDEDLRGLALPARSEAPCQPPSRYIMPAVPAPCLAVPPASPGCSTLRLEHAFEWNAEEALDSALVPAEAVALLQDACMSFQ